MHEIFNFDTPDADLAVTVMKKGTISLLTFVRERPDNPNDTVSIWLKTEWLERIQEKITEAIG
jgi:hypothetical protein